MNFWIEVLVLLSVCILIEILVSLSFFLSDLCITFTSVRHTLQLIFNSYNTKYDSQGKNSSRPSYFSTVDYF